MPLFGIGYRWRPATTVARHAGQTCIRGRASFGVEVILTRLRTPAAGSFRQELPALRAGRVRRCVGWSMIRCPGTLEGLGSSAAAPSSNISVRRRRQDLRPEEVGKVGKANTGTRLHFWPDPHFDSPKFSVRRLRRLLRAIKAVLCPGLTGQLSSARG